MIRSILTAATLTLGVCGTALAGTPVALRAQPVAHGAVTIADLFDGAGLVGAVVVAPAPAPGLNAVLDAARVQAVARAAGLDWDNAAGLRRIVVASAAGASLDGARAVARTTAARSQALAYAHNIGAGEIVGPSDLVWSDGVVAPLDAPGDPDLVIGQAARRPLRAGAAVMRTDLAQPVAVHRDETVSVAFDAGGVSLVLQAKALKDAGVGDVVQVQNPTSKKIIEAVVSAPGQAVVGPRADALKAQALSSSVRTASLR